MGKGYLFCSVCKENLYLILPVDRCPRCFAAEGCVCSKLPCLVRHVAVAFEGVGPGYALVRAFRDGDRPYLAKDIAAFMVQQMVCLDLPFPDLIVPVPSSCVHTVKRGYAPGLLLAQEIGKLMGLPVKRLIGKYSSHYPQSKLSKEQRLDLQEDLFVWRRQDVIADRVVLLVDDVVGTYTTLRHTAARLQEGFPAHIICLVASIDLGFF